VIHPNSIAVSREHRRAKTDRLDTALLKRAFLGWLRGERGHCSMAAIPNLEEEDAKRPGRKRENLVCERTRIGNRVKSTLARLGIRSFKPTLRTAAQRLERLRTPEGEPVPPAHWPSCGARWRACVCLPRSRSDGWNPSGTVPSANASSMPR
jgi:transposase